jgi:hypothetical protein
VLLCPLTMSISVAPMPSMALSTLCPSIIAIGEVLDCVSA